MDLIVPFQAEHKRTTKVLKTDHENRFYGQNVRNRQGNVYSNEILVNRSTELNTYYRMYFNVNTERDLQIPE